MDELQPLKSVYCLTVVKPETYATHKQLFFFLTTLSIPVEPVLW